MEIDTIGKLLKEIGCLLYGFDSKIICRVKLSFISKKPVKSKTYFYGSKKSFDGNAILMFLNFSSSALFKYLWAAFRHAPFLLAGFCNTSNILWRFQINVFYWDDWGTVRSLKCVISINLYLKKLDNLGVIGLTR